jgi:nucleotide-binding universal stress UspA family protein
MKTILVLTDFSQNALKAAESAAMLAGRLRTNILLFNSNYTVPAIPYYPGVILVNENISWEEECENKLKQQAEHLKKIIGDIYLDQRKPTVHMLLKEGTLASNINDLVRKENVDLIMMGGRSGTNIDHIMFGSDTSDVIDHAICPVLIVPEKKYITRLNKVLFATNYNESDIDAIEYLVKMGKMFEFQLEIVHVNIYGESGAHTNKDVVNYIQQLSDHKYPSVLYNNVKGKDLIERLNHLCKERESDLLAFTHQHHSYFIRMLKEGIVKKSLFKQQLPFLVFPSTLEKRPGKTIKKAMTGHRQ